MIHMPNNTIGTVGNQQRNKDKTTISDFIKLVQGEGATGYRYTWNLQTKETNWFSVEDTSGFAEVALNISNNEREDVYYGVCPGRDQLDTYQRVTIEQVASINCVWVDIDTLVPGHHAAKNLPTPAQASTLVGNFSPMPSIVVDSGGGYHVYWLFDKILNITDDEARQRAKNLCKKWNAMFIEDFKLKGWALDDTGDLARILRVPCTKNFKVPGAIGNVTIKHCFPDNRYSIETLERIIAERLPEGTDEPEMQDEQVKAPSGYPPSSAQKIIEKCSFIRHCKDDAENLSEIEWYCMIGNLSRTIEAPQVIHEFSKLYPKYRFNETAKKIKHAMLAAGPHTCHYIRAHSEYCEGCTEKVKAPVVLGMDPKIPSTIATEDPWDDPLPLIPEVTLPKFPTEVLPTNIRTFVEEEAEFTQTPAELGGLLVIAVCSLAVAKRFQMEGSPGWREPLNLYVLIIMEPGTRKSAVSAEAVEPLNSWEIDQAKEIGPQIKEAENLKEILDGKLNKKKSEAIKTSDPTVSANIQLEIEGLMLQLSEQDIPVIPRLLADDVTPEKLVVLMAAQKGRLGIMSTEGNIIEIMAGRYSDGSQNLEVFLKAHAGDDIREDRISRESNFIRKPALIMGLAVQPDVIEKMGQDGSMKGRGLLGRFLYAVPESLLGKRKIHTVPVKEETKKAYHKLIKKLLNTRDIRDGDGEFIPIQLRFNDEAQAEFDNFREWLEGELGPYGSLAGMTDWAGKLAGAVARISAIFWLVEHEGEVTSCLKIDKMTVEHAIYMAKEFFIPHAQAVYRTLNLAPDIQGAMKILRYIRDKEITEFSAREAFNMLHKSEILSNMEKMNLALSALLENGYIRLLKNPTTGTKAGRPGSPKYEVNPKYHLINA